MTPYSLLLTSSTSPDVVSSSLSLLWQLIETTPASLSEFDVYNIGDCSDRNSDIKSKKESEILTAQLDTIQAALAVCEIIQCYMPPPPLYFLIGTYDELIHNKSNSYIRVMKKQFIKELLNGCGFLIAGLEDIIHSSSSSFPSEVEVEGNKKFHLDISEKVNMY